MPGMVPSGCAALRAAGHGNAGDQPARIGMGGIGEDLRGGAGLDHLARVHHHDARGDAGDDAEVVRDQHEPHGKFALQLGEQVEDLGLDGDVQRRRGLVGEDQRGRAHQRHGDHHALAQAAGELVRVLLEAAPRRRHADALQQIHRALARLPARDAIVPEQRFLELVADGVGRVERRHRLLEDHGRARAADVGHLALGDVQHVAAGEFQALGGALRAGGQQVHDRPTRSASCRSRIRRRCTPSRRDRHETIRPARHAACPPAPAGRRASLRP